jgi:hypothetical protein
VVNLPSSLLSTRAHAQALKAVCFSGTTWSVLYVLCNSTSVCFYTEWSICPEEEDVTCRGSPIAHAFSGLPRQSAQTEVFLGRYGFLCPTMATLPYAGLSGVLSPSSIVLPLKTGDVDGPGS